MAPAVYGFPGHAETWMRRLWIAHLLAGPDSVVGFDAAGQIHGLTTVHMGVLSLCVPHAHRHGGAGARLHRIDDLLPCEIEVVRGLPVTTLPRTVVDLAGTVSRSWLKLIVEEVVYGRRVPIASVGATLARIRRRGKPGVRRLERVLDLLSPGEAVPHSHLEFLLDSCLERTDLPKPIPEYPLPTTQNMTGFVDRMFPEAALIIEADGRKWHERSQAVTRDRERDMQGSCRRLPDHPTVLGAPRVGPHRDGAPDRVDLRPASTPDLGTVNAHGGSWRSRVGGGLRRLLIPGRGARKVGAGCPELAGVVGQPAAGEPAKGTGSPGRGIVTRFQLIIDARLSVIARHSAGSHPSALPMTVRSPPMCSRAGISSISSALTATRSGSAKVRIRSPHGPRKVRASSSGAVTSHATR